MRILNLILLISLFCELCFSQVPQAFRYQAVARDNNGLLLKNKSIQVNASILDQSQSGPIVYKESHSTSTNNLGLFNLSIGQGTVMQGAFNSINWAVNDKYLSIEIDFGSGFQQMNVSQLLSVPYALYSGNPMPGPAGPVGPMGNTGPIGPQGIQGIQGLTGPAGLSIRWKGTFGNAPIAPLLNDAYYDSVQHTSFIWNGNNWNVLSKDGQTGATGLTGLQGNTGPQGSPGISINWLGSLSSPTPSPNLNDAYYNTVQHKSFVWDGSNWQILAQDGNTGPAGIQGATGPAGPSGLALNWMGTFQFTPSNASTNSAYYNSTLKASYVYDGSNWNLLAKDGNQGPPGSSYLKNFQFIATTLIDIDDTTDMAVVQIPNPWMVLPYASSVASGKIICFVTYTSANYQMYIAARGADRIMNFNSSIPQTSMYVGSYGISSGHTILVSDGISKWYVIER